MYYRSGTDGRYCIAPSIHCECIHQVAAPFFVKWHHGRHFESMTSNRKSDSVSRCVFTWRTSLPDFIPIRFETTEP